jgi:putative MFS transporter
MFIAFGLGALTTSKIKDRRFLVCYMTLAIYILTILMSYIKNLFLFTLFRIIVGYLFGALVPMMNGNLVEILPTKYRGFFMATAGIGFDFGAIFLNIIMYICMPNLEEEYLHQVILYSSFAILVTTLLFFYYFRTSPRFCILNDKEEEGLGTLEKIIGRKLNGIEKDIIISEVKKSNKKADVKFNDLFSDEYRQLTISMMILFIIISLTQFGGNFIMSLTIKAIEELHGLANFNNKAQNINSNIILKQLQVSIIALPGNIIAGVLSEIQFFGRKKTVLLGFIFHTFFTLLAVLFLENFQVFIGFAQMFFSLSVTIGHLYSFEVYNTDTRSMAIGLFAFCVRVAGFCSQYISIFIFNLHYLGMFYLIIIAGVIACTITYKFKRDTYGKDLDSGH